MSEARMPPERVLTSAGKVWAECEASKQLVQGSWSTRDVIIHAVESFARVWDAEFGFGLHDPSDVKELARWVGQHLEAAGKVLPRVPGVDDVVLSAATGILVAHQRMDIRSCGCGWNELGRLHARHQVGELVKANLLVSGQVGRPDFPCPA